MCVCVCVRARACVRACERVCVCSCVCLCSCVCVVWDSEYQSWVWEGKREEGGGGEGLNLGWTKQHVRLSGGE